MQKSGKCGGIFDLSKKQLRIAELDNLSGSADFWKDNEQAQKLMKERDENKKELDNWKALNYKAADIAAGLELIKLGEDPELFKEITEQLTQLKKDLRTEELKLYFTDKYDTHNAFLSIHPGAGGTESQDWASMLLRMYSRWTERKGFTVEMVDYQPGEEAGLKDVTLFVSGPNAYGFLKAEKGVHRLVRISPFDSNKRRHTSFASVDVMPEVDDVEVDIKDEEIRIDTYRASGAGGQHVNRTESAIRLTHYASGIVVTCQSERSQMKNKAMAYKVLKARLYEFYGKKRKEEMKIVQGEKKDIEWGSQIRSYVFQPYRLVKDNRTGVEVTNTISVMDGDIDVFIEEFLRTNSGKK